MKEFSLSMKKMFLLLRCILWIDKMFKFLLMNGSDLKISGKSFVAVGSIEIIKFCEQNHSSFKGSCETAIRFHRNEIFRYIYDNEIERYTHTACLHTFRGFSPPCISACL